MSHGRVAVCQNLPCEKEVISLGARPNGKQSTLGGLRPARFNYRVDEEEEHVGFIAEDVPDLLASRERKGLCSMDIVAVLTKVVQEQQKRIVSETPQAGEAPQ